MVVNPSLADKIDLIANTAVLGELLGIKPLKVAVLSAVEKVNTHFKSSLDAHELALHYAGDPRFLVEGPLSFDIAVSKTSAQHKGVGGEVPGDADVLLVPSLEAGNFLGKSFTYMAGAQSAGIILGARCPIVLTSRSDSSEAKLSSIALAVLLSRMTPPM
jgi:phosphate butyryltransferase